MGYFRGLCRRIASKLLRRGRPGGGTFNSHEQPRAILHGVGLKKTATSLSPSGDERGGCVEGRRGTRHRQPAIVASDRAGD